jgi:hypothetical protein
VAPPIKGGPIVTGFTEYKNDANHLAKVELANLPEKIYIVKNESGMETKSHTFWETTGLPQVSIVVTPTRKKLRGYWRVGPKLIGCHEEKKASKACPAVCGKGV